MELQNLIIMTYTNYQEIEDIKFVSPELVEIQKEQILKLFNEIKDLKEYLANERMRLSQFLRVLLIIIRQ